MRWETTAPPGRHGGKGHPGEDAQPAGERSLGDGGHQQETACGSGQEEKEDQQGRPGVDADLGGLGGFLPGLLGGLSGKGALAHRLLRPKDGLHGLVPDLPGLAELPPDGLQVHQRSPEPGNGVVLRQTLRLRLGAEDGQGGVPLLRLRPEGIQAPCAAGWRRSAGHPAGPALPDAGSPPAAGAGPPPRRAAGAGLPGPPASGGARPAPPPVPGYGRCGCASGGSAGGGGRRWPPCRSCLPPRW